MNFRLASDHANETGVVTASCNGKAILMGEHAVVYGAKAVAMPIRGKSISLSIADAAVTKVKINELDLTSTLGHLVDDAKKILRIEPNRAFSVAGKSTLSLGAGLGSSAALSVAIIKALIEKFNIDLSKKEIARVANQLEKRFHGSPSGLDVTVVAQDEPIIFERKNMSSKQLRLTDPGTFRFALIDSQKRISTKKMIEKASVYFQDQKQRNKLIKEFDAAADELIAGINTGSVESVSSAINKGSELLEQISVVSDDLKSKINEAKKLGCLAVKPTGAGGGGCLLSLLPGNTQEANSTVARLKEKFGVHNVFEVNL